MKTELELISWNMSPILDPVIKFLRMENEMCIPLLADQSVSLFLSCERSMRERSSVILTHVLVEQ